MQKALTTLTLVALAATVDTAAGADAYYHLNIGAPDLRSETRAVKVDEILDSAGNETLSPEELAKRLGDARIVLIGEEHTNMDFHEVQLRLIRALQASGRPVIIGLEMFPYEDQPVLDDWVNGVYSETGFIEKSDWYYRWGYHWQYYREIFQFAQAKGLRMRALNAPRPVITQLRKQGRDSLTDAQAQHLPDSIDTDSAEHLTLFKAYFGADDPIHAGMTDAQWQGMFQAQCAWDAVMGFNAVRALEGTEEDSVVVVLVGAGHVAYGQGIKRQIANWSDVKVATVMPVPTANGMGDPIDRVQASYGEFLWGLPATQPPRYPVLGAATIGGNPGLRIIDLDNSSAASGAGLKVGDTIVALDGVAIIGRREMNRQMALYRWGDRITLGVRRQDATLEFELTLARP